MKTKLELIQGLILLGLLYLFLSILKPFFASIILALVFAIVFWPVCRKVKSNRGWSESRSAFVTSILTFFIIIIPIFALISLIASEAIDFSQNLDMKSLNELFEKYQNASIFGYQIDLLELKDQLVSSLQSITVNISNTAFAIAGSIFNSIYQFFIFLLLYFYFLKDKEKLLVSIQKTIPYNTEQSKILMEKFHSISKTVFFANTLAALISGIFAAIGFYLFGLGSPVIWGLLVALLSLIPTVGSLFVYLLGVFLAYFLSGWQMALGLAVFYVIFDLILNENIIKPKLLDDKLSIHPILVFFAIVGGLNAFGAMGILYGPIVVIFLGTIYEFSIQKNN